MLGAAWYPEQWPESRWEADLQLMEDAHLHVVRVGEFAWSTMEPFEGRYDLDWLERAIRLAEKHHIKIVIGTPTDAPPAWLTSAHPETLRLMRRAAAQNMAAAGSSTTPIRNIASSVRPSQNNLRAVSGAIPMSLAGRLAMNSPMSHSTQRHAGNLMIGSNRNMELSMR